MEDIKTIIAENLVHFRNKAGLTQLQLAEMLNYSDKAVSKWERGESIPDLRVLVQIAKLYHITLDDIVNPAKEEEKVVKPVINIGKKRLLITLLSEVLVWFIATGLFAVLSFIDITKPYAYLSFVVATLATGIVGLVFSSLWGNRFGNALCSSWILWATVILIVVILDCCQVLPDGWWLFALAGLVFQVLIVLWFIFRKVK